MLQGLRGSLRRWREGRTSKKCKTTKLMGPLVRAGPSLGPWKEEQTWNKEENAFISRKRQKKFINTGLLTADFGPTSIFPGWMYQDQTGNKHSSVMLIVNKIYWRREMRQKKICWQSFRLIAHCEFELFLPGMRTFILGGISPFAKESNRASIPNKDFYTSSALIKKK